MLPLPELNFDQSNGKTTLNWEYDENQILGFEIHKSEVNNSSFELITEIEENEYSVPNVQASIQLFYKIKAFNKFESSEFSNEVTFLVTSLDETWVENIQVYPNPASSELRITSEFDGGSFEIMDRNGRILNQGNINQNVNVNHLVNGLYVVKIYIGDRVMTSKLVIQGK